MKNEIALAKIRQQIIVAGELLDVGKTGEAIVAALHPDWTRAANNTPGYDFTDENGMRVQVKTWASPRRTFDNIRNTADRLLRIQLYGDGRWEIIADIDTTPFFATGAVMIPFNRKGEPRMNGAVH